MKRLMQMPPQFRLIFVGMFFSTLGASMIWPFLMIYASETLGLPTAQVATLLTLGAATRIAASFLAGPLIDRSGRKSAMVVSLLLNAAVYLFFPWARTYWQFAILNMLSGVVNPLYRVGADAMLADLIPEAERQEAYALLRLSNNAGVSIGPAVGGFLAATSYTLAFYSAALGMGIYALLLILFAKETLPLEAAAQPREPLGGYQEVLKHRAFTHVMGWFLLGWLNAALMWVLLPLYAKQNFGIPENLYGFIPTANALMVIFLQMPVSRVTGRYPSLPMMALGMAFYALGTGSVALGSAFPHFLGSMIVMTIGELILVPTSSAHIANLAPPDKRGRYMSIYNLSWGVSSGIAPVIGGLLNDWISPQAVWVFGLLLGLIASLGLTLLHRKDFAYAKVASVPVATGVDRV